MTIMVSKDDQIRKPTSAFEVNYWVIPGGCDYSNAFPVSVFFDEDQEEEARSMERKYSSPPEMAHLTDLRKDPRAVLDVLKAVPPTAWQTLVFA